MYGCMRVQERPPPRVRWTRPSCGTQIIKKDTVGRYTVGDGIFLPMVLASVCKMYRQINRSVKVRSICADSYTTAEQVLSCYSTNIGGLSSGVRHEDYGLAPWLPSHEFAICVSGTDTRGCDGWAMGDEMRSATLDLLAW